VEEVQAALGAPSLQGVRRQFTSGPVPDAVYSETLYGAIQSPAFYTNSVATTSNSYNLSEFVNTSN